MTEIWQSVKDILAVYLSVKAFGNPLGLLVLNLVHSIHTTTKEE